MSEVTRQHIDSASMHMINMAAAGRSDLVDHVNFGRDDLPLSSMADPVQRMVAYITPDDLDPIIRREFFPPTGTTAEISRLVQKEAMAATLPLVYVLPDNLAEQSAYHFESIFREFASSPEVEDKPFEIIGILAVQQSWNTVFATSRSFFDTLVGLLSPEDVDYEDKELSEKELRNIYAVVSERAEGVIPPYEEWRAGRERFMAQEQPTKVRESASGLIAMLLLPEQQTNPVIRRRLLEPSGT